MVAPEQRKLKRFFVTLHNLSVLLFALPYHLSCLFSLLLYPQLNFLDHTEQSTTLRLWINYPKHFPNYLVLTAIC